MSAIAFKQSPVILKRPRPLQFQVEVSLSARFQRLTTLRLAYAAETGDVQALRQILPAINSARSLEALNEAIVDAILAHDHSEIVALLLDAGAEIEHRILHTDDATPLLFAAACGRMETVKLLIDRGADREACDGYWNNALHYAAESGQAEVAEWLGEIAPHLLTMTNTTEDGESLYPNEVAHQCGHINLAASLRGRRVPHDCGACLFFHDNPLLPCAVHPKLQPDCRDFTKPTRTVKGTMQYTRR